MWYLICQEEADKLGIILTDGSEGVRVTGLHGSAATKLHLQLCTDLYFSYSHLEVAYMT